MPTKAASIRWALQQAINTRAHMEDMIVIAKKLPTLHDTIEELEERIDELNEHIPNLELMARGNYDGPTLLKGKDMMVDQDYKRREREFNAQINPKPPADEIKRRQEERLRKRPKVGE